VARSAAEQVRFGLGKTKSWVPENKKYLCYALKYSYVKKAKEIATN